MDIARRGQGEDKGRSRRGQGEEMERTRRDQAKGTEMHGKEMARRGQGFIFRFALMGQFYEQKIKTKS